MVYDIECIRFVWISSILQCFILVYIVQIHMSQDLKIKCFLYCDFYDVLLTFI